MANVALARASSQYESASTRSPRVTIMAIAVAILLAGIVWFGVGSRRGVMHLEGIAHVGERQATIESGGWSYGVSDSVAWMDASGTEHEDGWPTCLGATGRTSAVKFGAVPVTLPDTGSTFRAVVYVDCRP